MKHNVARRLAATLGVAALPLSLSSCDWILGNRCELAELLMVVARAVRPSSQAAISFRTVPQSMTTPQVRELLLQSTAADAGVDLVLQVGDTLEVTGTERNRGDKNAGQHTMGFIQRALVDEQDVVLGRPDVPSLAENQEATRSLRVQATEVGVTILEVVADYDKSVKECKEGNNERAVDDVTGTSAAAAAASRAMLIVRVIDERGVRSELRKPGGAPQIARFRVLP